MQSGKQEDQESRGGELESASEQRAKRARPRLFRFALDLKPAAQERYRDTAREDTGAIIRHRAIVSVVGAVTLAASVTLALASDLSVFLKVLLAGLGAGVGALVLLVPVVYAATLAAAPHRQRNEARRAHAEAVEATEAARTEGERQLAYAREDAERRLRRAAAEADQRVASVQEQLDGALARIEELEAEDDPDARIALANRIERRAADLRALCAKWHGRINRGGILASGDERAATATSDFLEEYQRDHSIETRAIFDQLASRFRNIDPAKRGLVEDPRFSSDLLEVERLFSAAAKQLRERAEADPIEVDRVQLARDAYKKGNAIRFGNVYIGGAPTTAEESADAQRREWERAIKWGVETWMMVHKHFPGHFDRAFFGDTGDSGDYPLADLGFTTLAMHERDQKGVWVDTWMDGKLKVLADIIERYDRP